jgi:ABC-type multidrug transport system fused ATPase/permease subunit
MSILSALWRLLDERQRRQLVWLQLLSIVMALSTVVGVAAVFPFLTALADPRSISRNPMLGSLLQGVHFHTDTALVMALGAAFTGIVLVANAINLLGSLAINRFAFRVGDTLYVRLFSEYLHRDYEFHTRSNSAVLSSTVLQETARVTSDVLQQALLLVANLATIVCISAAMVLVNPVVAPVAIAGLGSSYAAIYLGTRRRLLRDGQTVSRDYAARARTVHEGLGAIREVTLVHARDYFVRRFAEQCRSISRAVCNTLATAHSPRYILECITVIGLVVVALYLRSSADDFSRSMAQLTFLAFAAYRLLPSLQQTFSAIVKIRASRSALSVVDLELRGRSTDGRAARVSLPESPWRGKPHREIRLCDVSFRYAPDRAAAVAHVSLTIPAGTIVGFVGPNGSGKTTLLDLIAGLLVPQSGHLEIDGIRLGDDNRAAWQGAIAYVPQQAYLFDATLAENVAFGIPAGQIDLQRVRAAVRLARLGECVAGLPNGYDELLGERGCRLSGGERQRLAIARGLYREASLLILDEATSGLDPDAEAAIAETLEALRPGRTILIIAHRERALRHCDLLFELRDGRVAVSGKQGSAPVLLKTGSTQIS